MATKKYWVRLTDMHLNFLKEVMRRTGIETYSGAIKFCIEFLMFIDSKAYVNLLPFIKEESKE